MAHEINRTNGQDAFYSLRVPAWHGLGQVVNRPMSDPEVLQLAGLDWEATEEGLHTNGMEMVATHKAIVRSDTREILGVVGADYATVQNAECLAWFRDVAGARDCVMETAGALGKGERVWALARIPDLSIAIGQDRAESYMLVTTGHDGRTPVRIMPTTVRVVCANTLRMALRNASGLSAGYSIRHTSGAKEAMASIASAYKRTMEAHAATRDAWQALANVRSTGTSLETIVRAAFPIVKDEQGDESQRAKTIREEREARVRAIRRSETCNVQGTAGTVFSDLQAVTEYVDHDSRKDAAERWASSQFGGSLDDAKSRAWDAALALV